MAFAAKDGVRVPTSEELDQLYKASDQGALKGTFNQGEYPTRCYWSSSSFHNNDARIQNFKTGFRALGNKVLDFSLRCVC